MMLRYLVKRHRRPTAKEIREYRDRACCGIKEAQEILTIPDEKVLQFLSEVGWIDVPVVIVSVSA